MMLWYNIVMKEYIFFTGFVSVIVWNICVVTIVISNANVKGSNAFTDLIALGFWNFSKLKPQTKLSEKMLIVALSALVVFALSALSLTLLKK